MTQTPTFPTGDIKSLMEHQVHFLSCPSAIDSSCFCTFLLSYDKASRGLGLHTDVLQYIGSLNYTRATAERTQARSLRTRTGRPVSFSAQVFRRLRECNFLFAYQHNISVDGAFVTELLQYPERLHHLCTKTHTAGRRALSKSGVLLYVPVGWRIVPR